MELKRAHLQVHVFKPLHGQSKQGQSKVGTKQLQYVPGPTGHSKRSADKVGKDKASRDRSTVQRGLTSRSIKLSKVLPFFSLTVMHPQICRSTEFVRVWVSAVYTMCVGITLGSFSYFQLKLASSHAPTNHPSSRVTDALPTERPATAIFEDAVFAIGCSVPCVHIMVWISGRVCQAPADAHPSAFLGDEH